LVAAAGQRFTAGRLVAAVAPRGRAVFQDRSARKRGDWRGIRKPVARQRIIKALTVAAKPAPASEISGLTPEQNRNIVLSMF
jgi:hypothetical protein